ncbi:MAG: EAL domain-containing protein [Rhodocyclaceae bacterium]|nr:EAL domain-containing protein [Rhodocyclaceae bacterium]
MTVKTTFPTVFRKIWLTVALFLALALVFGFYVQAEKRIDRAHEERHALFLLAEELRHTSDDLTRMAHGYVATGNPVFKQYFQDIMDIRDGRQPRPENYDLTYWNRVLASPHAPRPRNGQPAALLDLLRQAGVSDAEIARLTEAKTNSDLLTTLEFAAMQLAESNGPRTEANRTTARRMLHDENYHRAKSGIMQPINEFFQLMEGRTRAAIRAAEDRALLLRGLFIAILLAALFALWRAYAGMRRTLGGPVDEIHARMSEIGRGDFSGPIAIAPGMEHSVLAGLLGMQKTLQAHVTERKLAECELRVAAAAFESQEGTMVTDAHGVILKVNRAFTASTGYTAAEAVGQTPRLIRSSRHNADFYRAMWESIDRTGGWQGEVWDRRKNGTEYPKWLTISAVKNADGAITHYVGTHFDITERKRAEDKINELAFFDPLTGLPNRTLLQDRLKQAMTASVRNASHGALLFIDLDNFKTLNDTQGHDMGDLLLKQVAERLTTCVREGDTVARIGGDEFVVVLTGLSALEQDAAASTEAVGEKILAALGQSFSLGAVTHRSTASIGITLFDSQPVTLEDLLKQADLAMYQAKDAGRNVWRFFDPTMQATVMKRAALEADLHEAVRERQFLLHYQAQIVGEGRLTGAEVLVRWQHPVRGMVSPAEFIPLAEATGLILPLGEWVLETACAQLAAWAKQPAMSHLTVAVNVSARQFHQRDFVDQVLAVLDHTGANPQRLKLELTESLLVANIEQIIEKMHALKARGVGFSLDDFGTGYSSLSYLKRLPLDQLKIDQSFVRDVLTDPNDAAIARTVVALAHGLGLDVIAEGVETAAQRDFLANAGCYAYQGYFFGRPQPINDFEALVQRG